MWKRRGAKGEPAETPAASAAAPAATEPEGPSRPRTRKAAAAAAVKAPEVKVKVEVKQEQESESGMIELFGSPASPTGPAAAECGSVVSALTAIMDRGVYGDGTDYSSLVRSLTPRGQAQRPPRLGPIAGRDPGSSIAKGLC